MPVPYPQGPHLPLTFRPLKASFLTLRRGADIAGTRADELPRRHRFHGVGQPAHRAAQRKERHGIGCRATQGLHERRQQQVDIGVFPCFKLHHRNQFQTRLNFRHRRKLLSKRAKQAAGTRITERIKRVPKPRRPGRAASRLPQGLARPYPHRQRDQIVSVQRGQTMLRPLKGTQCGQRGVVQAGSGTGRHPRRKSTGIQFMIGQQHKRPPQQLGLLRHTPGPCQALMQWQVGRTGNAHKAFQGGIQQIQHARSLRWERLHPRVKGRNIVGTRIGQGVTEGLHRQQGAGVGAQVQARPQRQVAPSAQGACPQQRRHFLNRGGFGQLGDRVPPVQQLASLNMGESAVEYGSTPVQRPPYRSLHGTFWVAPRRLFLQKGVDVLGVITPFTGACWSNLGAHQPARNVGVKRGRFHPQQPGRLFRGQGIHRCLQPSIDSLIKIDDIDEQVYRAPMTNDVGVKDVPQPDLFPAAFPAAQLPQYVWEGEKPAHLPAQAWTTETTHRDGQQGGLPLTAEEGLNIYELMGEFTGQSGALRQAEFFVYRRADQMMLEGALARYREGHPVEPTTWIRATRKDADLVAGLGVRETGMLASASDYHTFHKFTPAGRRQAARTYLAAVEAVLDAGLRPRLHLEDATRAPREFILPFVAEVQRLAAQFPERQAPKFRICDTMGVGLPLENVAWPRSVPGMVRALIEAGVPGERLEFHPHNDTHLIVANCLAAVMAGCAAINGTLLGKGERSGNAPLEGVLLHLVGMHLTQSPNFPALNKLADLYEQLGQGVPAKYPLYGRDAWRTRAGIHADGLNKFWPMYAPFDAPGLLGRPLEVSLTKDSGLAGLIFLIKQHTGQELPKDHAGLQKLHAALMNEFDAGRQTAVEWEEVAERALPLITSEALPVSR